jgi:hypothetical protein
MALTKNPKSTRIEDSNGSKKRAMPRPGSKLEKELSDTKRTVAKEYGVTPKNSQLVIQRKNLTRDTAPIPAASKKPKQETNARLSKVANRRAGN